jgi:hypothetical protein
MGGGKGKMRRLRTSNVELPTLNFEVKRRKREVGGRRATWPAGPMARAARLSQFGGREEEEWRAEIVDRGLWMGRSRAAVPSHHRSTISDPPSGFRVLG